MPPTRERKDLPGLVALVHRRRRAGVETLGALAFDNDHLAEAVNGHWMRVRKGECGHKGFTSAPESDGFSADVPVAPDGPRSRIRTLTSDLTTRRAPGPTSAGSGVPGRR